VGKRLLDHLRDAFAIDLDSHAVRVLFSDYDMLVRVVVASLMLFTVA
jgi:hypothetical protein